MNQSRKMQLTSPYHRFSFIPPVRAVIFDVDGTLYDKSKLYKYMLLEMLRFAAVCPARLNDLRILWYFRRLREKNASSGNLEQRQFEWAAGACNVPVERVRHVIEEWMFMKPLAYLRGCLHPGIRELFSLLRWNKIPIGVFSDYPVKEKLDALQLKADAVVSATDAEVDRLKPDPKGLIVTASKLNAAIGNCLSIGDRDDKDGECARRAGMPYLILNRSRSRHAREFTSFAEITNWLQSCAKQDITSDLHGHTST